MAPSHRQAQWWEYGIVENSVKCGSESVWEIEEETYQEKVFSCALRHTLIRLIQETREDQAINQMNLARNGDQRGNRGLDALSGKRGCICATAECDPSSLGFSLLFSGHPGCSPSPRTARNWQDVAHPFCQYSFNHSFLPPSTLPLQPRSLGREFTHNHYHHHHHLHHHRYVSLPWDSQLPGQKWNCASAVCLPSHLFSLLHL